MTANYKLDSMFEIRKFFWKNLVDLGLFNEEDYYADNLGDTFVPILPVQQSPEFNQFLSGKKHIVYDKIGVSYDEMWLVCNEQILFTIYSTSFDDINEIRNLMIDLFRRMDDTASDINKWSGLSDKFKFFSIYVSDMSPTAASEEMQGFLSADVVLEVKYSRITDQVGRFL